jgi:hypothetical protein
MNYIDWVGTLGVSMILTDFFCSTFKIISGQGKLFFILNMVGAALACYASYLINYWPFVILEGIWTIVSLVALLKIKK